MNKQTITFEISGTASQEFELLAPDYSLEDLQQGLRTHRLHTSFCSESSHPGDVWQVLDSQGQVVAYIGRAKFNLKLDNGLELERRECSQIIGGAPSLINSHGKISPK